MAGMGLPTIYCWKIQINDLHVYLASTGKGAVRIGVALGRGDDCIEYFRELMPTNRLLKKFHPNLPLIKEVESILQYNRHKRNLTFDFVCTPFQWLVYKAVANIPFGETRSYGEIAFAVGKPNGARAVGQALKKNQLPIIFPCHRVIGAGGIGGFSSGLAVKKYLLEMEKQLRER